MPQNNWLNGPDYYDLVKKIIYLNCATTRELLSSENSLIERKNVLRKLKKLEKVGIIKTQHKKENNQNEYYLNLPGLALQYLSFLEKEFSVNPAAKRTISALKEEKNREVVERKFHFLLSYFKKAYKTQKTIKQVFQKITLQAYAAVDKKVFPEGTVLERMYIDLSKIYSKMLFELLIYDLMRTYMFYKLEKETNAANKKEVV